MHMTFTPSNNPQSTWKLSNEAKASPRARSGGASFFWGGLVGLLITPLFSPQNSLFFPSKLTEFYLANQHVMKEIILAKIASKVYETTFNRYNQQHYNSKSTMVLNF